MAAPVSNRLTLPRLLVIVSATMLAACTTVADRAPLTPNSTETIQILALNDFHGNIEVPGSPTTFFAGDERHQARLGGAARLGAALSVLRSGQEQTITVAAGDMIGASPLISSYFLDEPTVVALNRLDVSLVAVGNHEFDRGTAELRRIQTGGCEMHTSRQPCQLDKTFEGAAFQFLAANVLDEHGRTLFPGMAVRQFGDVRLGFIGMTLKETGILVSPAGVSGYRFADEVETANTLAAQLRREGADAIVLLIHQGGVVNPANSAKDCPELDGDILPILGRLDPTIRLVVSGHTHMAYICHLPARDGSTRLLTSAGRYGAFVTDIRLEVDATSDEVLSLSAENRPITGAAGEQPDVSALVDRYAAAIAPIAGRVVGRIEGSLASRGNDLDSPLGNLIADAQLAATRDEQKGGADIAFINSGGVRARFTPATDGAVTYGQIFALQPFGNNLVVLEMTGSDLKRLLEQQFAAANPAAIRQSMLIPSEGFSFSYDRARPTGDRIVAMSLLGQPIDTGRSYRVTVNNFLASGGDGFSVFAESKPVADAGLDLDALEAYIAGGIHVPPTGRVRDETTRTP